MKSKKTFNPDGSTKQILINNNGIYSAFTPKETVQAINALLYQLWSGRPLFFGWKHHK